MATKTSTKKGAKPAAPKTVKAAQATMKAPKGGPKVIKGSKTPGTSCK